MPSADEPMFQRGADSTGAILSSCDRPDAAQDVPISSQLQCVFHRGGGETRPMQGVRERRVAYLPLWAVDTGGV